MAYESLEGDSGHSMARLATAYQAPPPRQSICPLEPYVAKQRLAGHDCGKSEMGGPSHSSYFFELPAAVRFLSCEPLLGPIDLTRWLARRSAASASYPKFRVIVGGESGPQARPLHPAWIRHLRDQCTSAGVAFHFKQWGNWRPTVNGFAVNTARLKLRTNQVSWQ